MDNLSKGQRSAAMAKVRAANTKPEMMVRRALHRLGYRYVLHDRRLPGVPDLVFPSRKKVIFVHGCFWHQHLNCRYSQPPTSRIDFWLPKLAANRIRDAAANRALRKVGWKVLVVWECELRDPEKTMARMSAFLES